jgi:hypothetical protein
VTPATLAAVGLSLISAVAYATAAVAQERLAARGNQEGGGLLALLRRGVWWWSVGLNAAGALLGALTLVAAVPLGAYRAGRKVSRGEWQGTAYTLVGLGAILLTAAGTAPSHSLSLPQALAVSGAAAGLAALLVLSLPGARPGLRHATASGVASGVASALTQTVTVAFSGNGGSGLPGWQIAIVVLLVAASGSSCWANASRVVLPVSRRPWRVPCSPRAGSSC